MNIQKLNEVVAAVRGNELLLSSPQDALDLIATARYETGCEALKMGLQRRQSLPNGALFGAHH